jgi:hypothetical protein
MRRATTIARWGIRVSGTVQLLMGLVIWTGAFDQLIPAHIANGVLLVVALWVLAGLAGGRAPVGQVVIAFVWGLIMPIFGIIQDRLLPGSLHWTLQVLHLLIGLAAIGMGEGLGRAILSSAPAERAAAQ